MPDTRLAKERLGFLDVARALAALVVLAEHVLGACLPEVWRASPAFGHLGRVGVILFLLVSGFIIPASLAQGGSNARFWLRRFFRLFPAYWLSIAVAYLACWRTGSFVSEVPGLQPTDWLLNLTMLQGFVGRPHVWGVFWTLQIELTIYAACSLLFATGLLRRVGPIAWLALAGYVLLGLARPFVDGKPFGIGGQRFLYFAPLVGLVAHHFCTGHLGRSVFRAWTLLLPGSLIGVWYVNHSLYPSAMTTACLWEFVWTWGSAGGCFLLLLAVRGRTMPAVGCWLGRISYSVYLLHPFVLLVVSQTRWPAWLAIPGAVLGTLTLAELSYRFVERPGIALGRVIERWLTPIPAPAPVQPLQTRMHRTGPRSPVAPALPESRPS